MERNLLAILLSLVLFSSCATDSREDEFSEPQEQVQDSIPTLRGEFMLLADQAVIKGEGFIYGVTIDSLAQELAQRVEPLKENEFDMISVVVKAKVSNNFGRQGWDEVVEIREIVDIPEETSEVEADSLETEK